MTSLAGVVHTACVVGPGVHPADVPARPDRLVDAGQVIGDQHPWVVERGVLGVKKVSLVGDLSQRCHLARGAGNRIEDGEAVHQQLALLDQGQLHALVGDTGCGEDGNLVNLFQRKQAGALAGPGIDADESDATGADVPSLPPVPNVITPPNVPAGKLNGSLLAGSAGSTAVPSPYTTRFEPASRPGSTGRARWQSSCQKAVRRP